MFKYEHVTYEHMKACEHETCEHMKAFSTQGQP